jgi:hypothetical protein
MNRHDIIEECARIADEISQKAYSAAFLQTDRAKRWHLCDRRNIAKELADAIRALKSTTAPQKNDCQNEDPITILKEALRQANSYIDSTPLMPGNSYKEIKAVIRDALECDKDAS